MRRLIPVIAAACAALAGCGGSDSSRDGQTRSSAQISVVDSAAPLTSSTHDGLFTLTLVQSSRSFPIADVAVSVQPTLYGAARGGVDFVLVDTNANGAFDPGEALSCAEQGNGFDATYV